MAENGTSSKNPTPATPPEPWKAFAAHVGVEQDADVVLFSGEIEDKGADELIRLAKRKDRRPNVFLILTTRGGSADAAFRMARCLQSHYTKLTLYIHGMCKSAGTLVAIGVDEIVLSDFGEFGPLDVQLGKKDELWETTSGLDVTQALNSLNIRAYNYFKDTLVDIRTGTQGQISTKLAAEIASKLAVGVYSNIYSQIDPVQLGAIERAMRIAVQYGYQLARTNVQANAVDRLATSYPSHSFVIDLEEARTLFKNVRTPSDLEEKLGECLSFLTRDETESSVVELINEKPQSKPDQPEKKSESDDQATGENPEGKRSEGGANHGASREISFPKTDLSIAAAGTAG